MEKIIKLIENYKSFALFAHVSPDADTLGSCKALKLALEKMGKKAYIFCDGKINFNNTFLNITLEKDESLINNSEALIAIDISSQDRLGKYKDVFLSHTNTACVDHHTNGYKFAKFNFIKTKYSSTALIILEILEKLKCKISPEIAEALYAGMSSDTGCFKHPNTDYLVHEKSAMLIKTGFNLERCNYELFKRKNEGYVPFLKMIIKNYKISKDNIGILFLNYKNFLKIKTFYDSDLINEIFSENNTLFFVLVAEKEKGKYKLGFRSKDINVEKIARSFGGGGHVLAAGADITISKKELLSRLNTEIKKALYDRNN